MMEEREGGGEKRWRERGAGRMTRGLCVWVVGTEDEI
jgi:hypothetical protein